MHNVGRVVSRDQLSAHLPEGRPTRRSNVIDVHIRALRSKLDDPFDEPMIETIRGAGYRIRRPQPAPSPF
jgi:DNA-binding response OmpR family regulator